MAGVGRNFLGATGTPIRVSFDGRPIKKAIGITIDWGSVAAVSGSPATTSAAEGISVPVGGKYLRYGQVLTRISNPSTQTLTIGGTATSGSFPIQGYRPDIGTTVNGTINWNSSVAQTQAVMDTLFGAGNTVVSGGGTLDANVQTVTFAVALQYVTVPLMVVGPSALVGTSPTITAAIGNAGTNTGMYGPYDSAASDGRQTLTNSQIVILDETIVKDGLLGTFSTVNSVQRSGIVGGKVYRARVLATSGSHSLAAGPTYTELLAAMPLLELIQG